MSLHRTFVLRGEENARSLYEFLKVNWRPLADQDKPLAVTVSEHRAKRSTDQNKRYWALLHQVSDDAWVEGKQFSAEAWAEFYKKTLIGYEETPDGRQIGISTTTLDVAEFSAYMDKIEQHAAEELGLQMEQAA